MARLISTSKPHLLPRAFLYWLPLAFVMTVYTGLVYVTVQQSYRQGANDPQIQMAQDAAAQLQGGAPPQDIVGSTKIDLSRSLAPFLIVYDSSGKVLSASGQLNGSTPDLPTGVFSAVRSSGEDRLSWQPQDGVRIAAVVDQYSGSNGSGFVLAGRSLREVEDRESRLTQMIGIALLVGIIGSFGIYLAVLSLADRLLP